VIRIPKDVVEGARVPEDEFERIARVELATALYARGILSIGQARRLAGLTKWEFLEELAKRSVERHYTREELEDDLALVSDSSPLIHLSRIGRLGLLRELSSGKYWFPTRFTVRL